MQLVFATSGNVQDISRSLELADPLDPLGLLPSAKSGRWRPALAGADEGHVSSGTVGRLGPVFLVLAMRGAGVGYRLLRWRRGNHLRAAGGEGGGDAGQ